MIDIEKIKANSHIETVIAERVELKRAGNEYKGLCPFHSEKTPSFSVSPAKGWYYCFGCGAHGDVLDFVMEYHGVDMPEAGKILGGEEAPDPIYRKRRLERLKVDIYEGIKFSERSKYLNILTGDEWRVWNPKRQKWSTYSPAAVYCYTPGQYVHRIELGDGKKITPMVSWCKWGEEEGWCFYQFPEPRPLYGELTGKPVLVVEGEKARDAAQKLLGEYYDAVTWAGGTQAPARADWSPLKGKKVLLWGDADLPGEGAMNALAVYFAMTLGVKELKLISWDKSKPKGWDVADAVGEGWDKDKTIAWAKERLKSLVEEGALTATAVDVSQKVDKSAAKAPPPTASDNGDGAVDNSDERPFRPLGHFHGTYYYFPHGTQQVVALTPSQHHKNNFYTLAKEPYWENNFPSKSGVNWDAVTQSLLSLSERQGYFMGNDVIRGRGAWIDEGHSVLHLGTKVYVDGKAYSPREVPSKFCYEGGQGLDIDAAAPATSKEAHKLVKLCSQLNWEHPLSGVLLAGWCVVAPVCGVLKWRPHVWLTGASGAGKSTVIHDICEPVMGGMRMTLEGQTTEAGIRQALKRDALPVILDEAEGENKQAMARMQSVLTLARISSSGGTIRKGTVDGQGQAYTVRSCFLFSSINVNISEYADESRISKLVLKKDVREDADAQYEKFKGQLYKTFTREYSERLLARSLKHLPALRANSETFMRAAAIIFRSRRIADQIGALLAGYYLCHSTKEVTIEEASKWIEGQNWGDHTSIHAKKDEERLLDKIATRPARVDCSGGVRNTTIGELVLTVHNGHSYDIGGHITPEEAIAHLRLQGIKVEDDTVWIANNSEPMQVLLRDTPWASSWARPLKDLYDAVPSENTIYFSSGIRTRATGVPVKLFKGE